MKEIIEVFEGRRNAFTEKSNALKKEHISLSWARIIAFILAVVLVVLFANSKTFEGIIAVAVLFPLIFFTLLKKHVAVKNEKSFQEELAKINEEEILRKNGDLSSFDHGTEFIEPTHPYHIDLDVFGKNSVFQLVNRTSTSSGKKKLAKWLSKPERKEEILKRQDAIKELGVKVDWRQHFEAYGRTYSGDESGIKQLIEWLGEPNRILKNRFYTIAIIIFPLATLTSILLWSFGLAPLSYLSLIILINIGILGSVLKHAKDIYSKTVKSNQALTAFENQIRLIEEESFASGKMTQLKSHFLQTDFKASDSIKSLQFVLDGLHNRANLLYWPFNLGVLMDVFWLLKAEKWKDNSKGNIAHWFDSIGEVECLISFSGYHFANPEFQFPDISETTFEIEGIDVGHPLIKYEKRVSNTFNFSGKGGICLITGSNMSGKSTFLRTVGVNAVLALLGAPVCAKSLKISHLQVFTSMRTQDDLEESVSSFYAELKRLKQLLGSINSETPVLFMIDEVLKGTNSEDRHKGAIALIRQLNRAYAYGFVSTHDIELGKITNELTGVKNYSFNSVIKGDEIIFDYTLTEGICKSFNATKLMQLMGIEIIE